MAWTSPLTATPGRVFTASDFNTHIRDNLLATEGAVAQTPGSYFISNMTGSAVERHTASNTIDTAESRDNLTYGDLDTVGPSITITTGQAVIIGFGADVLINTPGGASVISVGFTGSETIAPSDIAGFTTEGVGAGTVVSGQFGSTFFNLAGGSYTVTCKYRSSANVTYSNRWIMAIPL